MSALANSIYNLGWTSAFWEDLTESRLHKKPRRWGQMVLIAEQAEVRDYEIRIERFEAVGTMPGEHPAPVDVRVLDLMVEILADAEDLAWVVTGECRRAAFAWPGAPSTGFADARPYLDLARAHLTEELANYAAPITGRMATQTAHALALVADGQLLNVVCPWCRGVTPETPAGGARTWYIRNLLADLECVHGQARRWCNECEQHIAIVCEGGTCEPPTKDVGTWLRGRPCWPLNTWRWLGKRVMSEAEQAARAREMIAS